MRFSIHNFCLGDGLKTRASPSGLQERNLLGIAAPCTCGKALVEHTQASTDISPRRVIFLVFPESPAVLDFSGKNCVSVPSNLIRFVVQMAQSSGQLPDTAPVFQTRIAADVHEAPIGYAPRNLAVI